MTGTLGSTGNTGLLAGLVLATLLIRTVLGNIATVVLVAAAIAEQTGVNRALAVGVAIAASAAFVTPRSYQTNLMVYGPRGYRRLGAPITALGFLPIVGLVPQF